MEKSISLPCLVQSAKSNEKKKCNFRKDSQAYDAQCSNKRYHGRFSLSKETEKKYVRAAGWGNGRLIDLLAHHNNINQYLRNEPYKSLQVQEGDFEDAEDISEYKDVSNVFSTGNLTEDADDRNVFYRNLMYLLSSSSTKLNRPSEDQSTLEPRKKTSRQHSVVTHGSERFKLSDVIWLQLQAVISGCPMKSYAEQSRSTSEYDSLLFELRRSRAVVFDEIRNFRSLEAVDNCADVTSAIFRDAMKANLNTVRNLLEEYEQFEELFPTNASLAKAYPSGRCVQDRISLLNMWYNTTVDLYSRIKEVATMLFGINSSKSSRRLSVSPRSRTRYSSEACSPVSTSHNLVVVNDSCNEALSHKEIPSRASSPAPLELSSDRFNLTHDLVCDLSASKRVITDFVSKSLRLKGMHKVLQRLEDMCMTTIKKTVVLLQKPSAISNENVAKLPFASYCKRFKFEKVQYTLAHPEFLAMSLPSLASIFLFLVWIPLDLVHEWLRMRTFSHSTSDPLTLQAMIEDYRDCIFAAIRVKHKYMETVAYAGLDCKTILNSLASFEDHLSDVSKLYLKCLRDWAQSEILMERSGTEWVERLVQRLLGEWKVARKYAVSVIAGESEVVHRFCIIGADLLEKMVKRFFLDRIDMSEDFQDYLDTACTEDSPPDIYEYNTPRRQTFIACRYYKSLIVQLRERSLRALFFVRTLLTDVEICTVYRLKSYKFCFLLYQLYVTSHCLVNLPCLNDRYFIYCDAKAANNPDFIQVLLNITCSRYESELSSDIANASGYLLFFPVKTHEGFSAESWKGERISVDIDADTEISLGYLQFDGDVCIVALNGILLVEMRLEFFRNLTSDAFLDLEMVEEQVSCHETVSSHVDHLKEVAIETCDMIWNDLAGRITEELLHGRIVNCLEQNELESFRATVIQAYNLAFEYHKEVYRILPKKRYAEFALKTSIWVEQWLTFVEDFANHGDGSIPLWSLQSFQFLTIASEPQLTSLLPDHVYSGLVRNIDLCARHIIGCQDNQIEKHPFIQPQSNECMFGLQASRFSNSSVIDREGRLRRIQSAINELDEKRSHLLEAESKIGRVRTNGQNSSHLNAYFNAKKCAPFEWQRLEKKIGSGKFGTVYAVMNLTDNCLLAMKQVRIEKNHKALHALVDEVENLRSLDHPNLVKYYAVEVHKDELFIFMEYCSEGTLETVCREGRLEMCCVRRYTHFLLRGIAYIHNKLIIHRDIKPANIFLGHKNVLKLGDFGSSVRLKACTTARGEVADWVGTPAYMAPEVQTLGGKIELSGKEENVGYGRASDIWSIGCVVLEMCSGKPPWHECEQFLQIVFRVGSGMQPTIPLHIQSDADCSSFLNLCFQANPSERATAEELLQHAFANISVRESVDSRTEVKF